MRRGIKADGGRSPNLSSALADQVERIQKALDALKSEHASRLRARVEHGADAP